MFAPMSSRNVTGSFYAAQRRPFTMKQLNPDRWGTKYRKVSKRSLVNCDEHRGMVYMQEPDKIKFISKLLFR